MTSAEDIRELARVTAVSAKSPTESLDSLSSEAVDEKGFLGRKKGVKYVDSSQVVLTGWKLWEQTTKEEQFAHLGRVSHDIDERLQLWLIPTGEICSARIRNELVLTGFRRLRSVEVAVASDADLWLPDRTWQLVHLSTNDLFIKDDQYVPGDDPVREPFSTLGTALQRLRSAS